MMDNLDQGMRLLQALPMLTLLLIFAPLVALASWRRIYPHIPLVLLMIGPCLLTFALLIWSDLFLVVAIADIVVVLIAVADCWTLPGVRAFSAERSAMRIASINMPHQVSLTISNQSGRSFFVAIRDDLPPEFDATPDEFSMQMEPRSRNTMHYEFRSRRRGAFTLTQV